MKIVNLDIKSILFIHIFCHKSKLKVNVEEKLCNINNGNLKTEVIIMVIF